MITDFVVFINYLCPIYMIGHFYFIQSNIYSKTNYMTIKINDTDYKLKYTIRTFFIFEGITNRSYDGTKLMDSYILFYSMLLANNPDSFKMTFDDFINVCDDDRTLFIDFIEFLNKELEIQNQFTDEKKSKKVSKKKA